MEGKPHFYITGAQYGDQVMVTASIELRQLSIEIEPELESSFFDRWDTFAQREKYTLAAESSSLVRVIAPDYPTAFARLFERWSPEQQNLGIEGKKAIDG